MIQRTGILIWYGCSPDRDVKAVKQFSGTADEYECDYIEFSCKSEVIVPFHSLGEVDIRL